MSLAPLNRAIDSKLKASDFLANTCTIVLAKERMNDDSVHYIQ
ncbi:hypothetical protein [Vibrio coralliilyticus]|nr:hypothetical protein [Vibrio coralliilyticus]